MTKVLVAEDNPINRELLRELLENRGYAVVEACNGQEALRMVDETQPDNRRRCGSRGRTKLERDLTQLVWVDVARFRI
jgi:CheY-like chemotaxis protein